MVCAVLVKFPKLPAAPSPAATMLPSLAAVAEWLWSSLRSLYSERRSASEGNVPGSGQARAAMVAGEGAGDVAVCNGPAPA